MEYNSIPRILLAGLALSNQRTKCISLNKSGEIHSHKITDHKCFCAHFSVLEKNKEKILSVALKFSLDWSQEQPQTTHQGEAPHSYAKNYI